MNGRVCLLTFTQLPDLSPVADASPLAAAVDELTADSVVFDNHYLQYQGPSGVVKSLQLAMARAANAGGGSTGATSGDGLQTAASVPGTTRSSFGGGCATCFVVPREKGNDSGFDAPSWLNLTKMQADSTDAALANAGEILSVLQDAGFAWLHVDVAVTEDNHHLLADAVSVMKTLAAGADDLIMITSLQGHSPAEELPFESILWEGCVRTPMWLQHQTLSHRRIQCCTGSNDIGHTVQDFLSSEAIATETTIPTAAGTQSLLKLAKSPGVIPEREILIRTDSVTAIRTTNFLFAKSVSEGVPETAMYAKPEDIWHVSDVSTEYLATAEEFEAKLRALHADGGGA